LPDDESQRKKGELTRTRRFVFRGIALLLPFAALIATELLLRLVGYGYPTGFFLRENLEGSTLVVENRKFGERFFPRNLSRSPIPCVVNPHKAAGTYRIFVFGESAAQGHPEPAYSFSRILAVLLQAKYPDRRFEIINTAMTAINSHVIRLIAKDCTDLEGDLWIFYMGHNEVIGPFGTGSVFGADTPNRIFIHATLALQSTRLGQLLRSGIDHFVPKKLAPEHWGGLDMFSRTRVASSDPRLETVYRNFQQNLNDILDVAGSARVQTLLCSPATNLRECSPFASMHAAALAPANLAQCQELEKAGTGFFTAQNWHEAENAFRKASALDDQFAETHYRLGQCLLKLHRNDEAMAHLILARDRDALRLRADSRINQIILRAAAGRTNGRVRSLNAEKFFAREEGDKLRGEEFFYEHVHLTFEGNYRLARLVGDQIIEMFPEAVKRQAKGSNDWLSAEGCAKRLAWTAWDRLKSGTEMARWLQTGPFTNQPDHLLREALWERKLTEWRGANKRDLLRESSKTYQAALTQAPKDWMLHAKFAELLEAKQDLDGAIREWVEVSRLLPSHSQFYSRVGRLLDQQGKFRQAETVFRQALELEPDSAEAHSGLGLCQAHQGRYQEAIKTYHYALKLKPESVESHINLGLAFLALGNTNAAIAQQESALRIWPDNVPARINRGKLLQAQGKLTEALDDLAKALQLEPNNPMAQFNMGNILAALNRRPEAIEHYLQAAALHPDAPEVHLALGTQLRLEGRFDQANNELSTTIRLDPENAEAHYEFGRLLLEQGAKEEGLNQLRKALQFNPNHAGALKLLPKN
jgi:tetratricopeptide (TPR) repeat protein